MNKHIKMPTSGDQICFIFLCLSFKNVFSKSCFTSVFEGIKANVITAVVQVDYLDAGQDHLKVLIPVI